MTKSNQEPIRVLLVEDNELLSIAMKVTLEGLGCVVIGPAATLEEATELARSEQIHWALVDLHLGRELATPVAELLEERGCPFAFATGGDNRELTGKWASAPFMQKPIFKADLASRIEQLRASTTC